MGVLGQETMASGAGEDSAQGKLIKENFKKSGIVHLLAVSGGHFVLLAEILRRCAARCHLPRLPTVIVTAGGYAVLSALMFPSDSVTRAVVMGMMSLAAVVVKRPPQALSALCWTVIVCLLFDPDLAASFGFALSCAAVTGIVIFNRSLTSWLVRAMREVVAWVSQRILRQSPPAEGAVSNKIITWLAAAVAVTVSAQVLTFPVQLLMSSTIPLWSVFANVCVAPFVAFSTVCGLAALVISWVSPSIGGFFAFLASLGTGAMNGCASLFASLGGGAVESSVPGGVGALIALAVEAAIGIAIIVLGRVHCPPIRGD
jgi:competence protein ComEC